MVEAPYRRLPIHSFRRLRTALLLCLVSLSPCSLVPAQQLPMPVLHHRSDRDSIADMDTASRGRTTLPLEASGEYLLGGKGETVEMDLEPDRLSGYITRPGDQASDEETPLTFFFATSVLRGEELQLYHAAGARDLVFIQGNNRAGHGAEPHGGWVLSPRRNASVARRHQQDRPIPRGILAARALSLLMCPSHRLLINITGSGRK